MYTHGVHQANANGWAQHIVV